VGCYRFLTSMFSSLKLFQNLPCPDRINCTRPRCIFSHRDPSDLPSPPLLNIPFEEPNVASSSTQQGVPTSVKSSTIPAKRGVVSSPLRTVTSSASPIGEPPRKLQKLGSARKPSAVQTPSDTTVGCPLVHTFYWLVDAL
jgi:RNA exonuclease 1